MSIVEQLQEYEKMKVEIAKAVRELREAPYKREYDKIVAEEKAGEQFGPGDPSEYGDS
jgi:predicted N-acetyltransferase YhbS